MATSSSVQTYAAAQIFYSAGNTGLQILQQIFIADTRNLLNRALWSSIPDTPPLITVWIGYIIGNAIHKPHLGDGDLGSGALCFLPHSYHLP